MMTEEAVTETEAKPGEVLTSVGESTAKVDNPVDTKTAEAPKEFVYDFKFPENYEKDEASVSRYTEWAKKHNVSPEAAQELLDWDAERGSGRITAERKAWTDLQDKWVADVKSDKEVGGSQFMENLAVAK